MAVFVKTSRHSQSVSHVSHVSQSVSHVSQSSVSQSRKAYSFGHGGDGQLGHGGKENEHVPRLIEGVLVGKSVVGVTTGYHHPIDVNDCRLGHGGEENELMPRLVSHLRTS